MQQFYALLIKQLKSDLRDWRSYLLKLFCPIAFLIIGLAVEMILAIETSDAKATISLSSAVDGNNITLFWAEFGSTHPLSFKVSQTEWIIHFSV